MLLKVDMGQAGHHLLYLKLSQLNNLTQTKYTILLAPDRFQKGGGYRYSDILGDLSLYK